MKKKIVTVILACLMSMSCMIGCGDKKEAAAPQGGAAPQESTASATLDKIQKAGKIVLATDPAWAPFEYIGANGDIVGSDIDLAQHIADSLGVKLEIINSSFDTLSSYIESGEADVLISAMTITEERKGTLDFSVPYTVASQYIIVPESNDSVSVVEDMAGYRIGTHLGTTGDFLVCDAIDLDGGALYGTGASYAQYKSLPDATLDMQNGQIDAIVCDVLLAKNLCAINEGLKCFELTFADGTKTNEELGIGMPKGDPAFVEKINEIITPLIEDGTVDSEIVKHTELAAEL